MEITEIQKDSFRKAKLGLADDSNPDFVEFCKEVRKGRSPFLIIEDLRFQARTKQRRRANTGEQCRESAEI